MKPDLYKALKNYAHESFEETYAGLYTRINSDKNFVNHVERKYRLKQYEQDSAQYLSVFVDPLHTFENSSIVSICEPSRAFSIPAAEMSKASTVCPSPARKMALRPSPQPMSSTRYGFMGGRSFMMS